MAGDHDRDLEFEIIQKSLTTAHIAVPELEPAPVEVPLDPPILPSTSQDADSE
jgi:hypothetical protein